MIVIFVLAADILTVVFIEAIAIHAITEIILLTVIVVTILILATKGMIAENEVVVAFVQKVSRVGSKDKKINPKPETLNPKHFCRRTRRSQAVSGHVRSVPRAPDEHSKTTPTRVSAPKGMTVWGIETVHMHVCKHMRICIYIYMYTHLYVYIHIYTCT